VLGGECAAQGRRQWCCTQGKPGVVLHTGQAPTGTAGHAKQYSLLDVLTPEITHDGNRYLVKGLLHAWLCGASTNTCTGTLRAGYVSEIPHRQFG
jgi:hypothetical protein